MRVSCLPAWKVVDLRSESQKLAARNRAQTSAAAIVTETHVEAKGKGTLSVHRKIPNKTRFVLPKHWCIKLDLSKADGLGWKNESRTDSDCQRGGILLEPYG